MSVGKICHMAKVSKIHSGKQAFRRHFLPEWLEERQLDPMQFLDLINEGAGMDLPIIDKSQVYRWLKGQLPQKKTQLRIAGVLELLDADTREPTPEKLFVHPAQEWITEKLRGRTADEIRRAKQAVDLVLFARTGTNG